MKPSDFKNIFPFGSITDRNEDEDDALKIMRIRSRLGENWGLTFDEYKKDEKFSNSWTETNFTRISEMIDTPEKARDFSPCWAELYS